MVGKVAMTMTMRCGAFVPLLLVGAAYVAPANEPYRWFPEFPAAEELLVVPFAGDPREGMVLEGVAGLLGKAAIEGRTRTLLWEDLPNDGYQWWFASYVADHAPKVTHASLDEAVRRAVDLGVVRGYVLYDYDTSDRPLHSAGPMDASANVATALVAREAAIPVCVDIEERYRGLGLARVLDVRGMTEEQCLERYGDGLATNALGMSDPKARNARSLMIAMGTAVVSGVGEAYGAALRRCEPDSPVIGWGCGSEDGITSLSSRMGLFQTATNWCHNLTVLAEEDGFDLIRPWKPPAKQASTARHRANLTLTDGDNIQWLMGNFMGGSEARFYYANPHRGEIPFTWGIPGPGLAQLSPRTLAELFSTATPNDDFILYSGGGYFYPDLYGSDRPEADALALHARRLRAYCDLTGVRILAFNFMDWDGADAMRACEALAKSIPGLLGILAFQYYPYPAGEGRVMWVEGAEGDRVPVVSCAMTVWAQTGRERDTTPAAVAARLNEVAATTESSVSWVLVHAWSYFRPADPSADLLAEERDVAQDGSTPGSTRGYEPALWLASRLGPDVRLCSAHELLQAVRKAAP